MLQHHVYLWKEFHHIMAVVILPHCRSGAMINLIWLKDGWLLKGVVLISCVSLLPLSVGVGLLTWWKTSWGVFCAEAVLDLILRA